MRFERFLRCMIGLAATATMLCACKDQKPHHVTVPEVGVITVQPVAVPVSTELPGRTSAFLDAQVRARVNGIVLRREFTEGSVVKAGQRLYKIDPAPYAAQLDSAKATLARAEANLASTTAQAERYAVLVQSGAVSRQNYDDAVASQKQAVADVESGRAQVTTARINLGYTDVTSPVTGQIGLSQVTPGAYVQATEATLMATVQQLDPMYVDLTQSSLDGLKLRRDVQEGRIKASGPDATRVSLILEDGRVYPVSGQLQFTDVSVNEGTGSVTVRAIFRNPDRVLLPGMFVRARIEQGVNERALLVPVQGITHDQKGNAVAMVVDARNTVSPRVLVTSGMSGQNWIVDGGLHAGERVVVEGIDKVRPGATVKAVPAKNRAPAAATAGAASAPASAPSGV